LEKHGYLTRRRLRSEGGRLGDIEYTIHEIPQTPDGGNPTEPPKKPPNKPSSPTLENPILVKPTLVLPTQENPTQCSNNVSNNNGLRNKELSNKKTKPPNPVSVGTGANDCHQLLLATDSQNQQAECLTVQTARGADNPAYHTMTLVEQQFEQFWQSYPRKAGKKAAKKAWLEIAPDEVLFPAIMDALAIANRYWKLHSISSKHIPHPSTWLLEERWTDEFSAEQLTAQRSNPQIPSDKGGVQYAPIGANYSIGGDNDPYRALTQG
jgi:hypothetical protein